MKNPKAIIGMVLLVLGLLGGLMVWKSHADAAQAVTVTITEVNEQNYQTEIFASTQPVFVLLYQPNCTYCEDQEVLVKELAKDYAGKVKFVRIDASTNPNLVANFGATIVPAMFVLKMDEKTIYGNEGFLDKPQLKKFIEDGLAKKHS